MSYSTLGQKLDEADTKRNVPRRQELFELSVTPLSVGQRLVQAFKDTFGSAEGKLIAEKLGFKTPQAAYKVVKNKGELNFEHLRNFRKVTKRSIDWLLTGEEAADVRAEADPNPYGLAERQLLFVERLAGNQKVSFEEMMREVVYAGLDAHARELSRTYRNMSTAELEEVLDAVLSNVDDGNGGEEEELPRQARRR